MAHLIPSQCPTGHTFLTRITGLQVRFYIIWARGGTSETSIIVEDSELAGPAPRTQRVSGGQRVDGASKMAVVSLDTLADAHAPVLG